QRRVGAHGRRERRPREMTGKYEMKTDISPLLARSAPRRGAGGEVKRPARLGAVCCLLIAGLGGCATEVPPAHVGIKFNANNGISEKLEKPQVVWCLPGDR